MLALEAGWSEILGSTLSGDEGLSLRHFLQTSSGGPTKLPRKW